MENFKYKIQQIESHTAKSASLVSVTGAGQELLDFDQKIREVKNNFDGYETYLYNVSSSYISSSMGEFVDASWPKTGSGTYAIPFEPVSSSNSNFTNWYGSVGRKTGHIYTASLYDILKTYSNIVKKDNIVSTLNITSSELFSVDESMQRLESMLGSMTEWTNIINFIPKFGLNKLINKSSVSSNFVASLELAKNGLIELKQNENFDNIFLRHKL